MADPSPKEVELTDNRDCFHGKLTLTAQSEYWVDWVMHGVGGEVRLQGFVKWDGCMEFSKHVNPHVCGPKDIPEHVWELTMVFREAHGMFLSPGYDKPELADL